MAVGWRQSGLLFLTAFRAAGRTPCASYKRPSLGIMSGEPAFWIYRMLTASLRHYLLHTYNAIRDDVPDLAGACYIFSPLLFLTLKKQIEKAAIVGAEPELHVGNIKSAGEMVWDPEINSQQCLHILNYEKQLPASLSGVVQWHMWVQLGQTLIDPTIRDMIASTHKLGALRDPSPMIEYLSKDYLVYNKIISYESKGTIHLTSDLYPQFMSVLTNYPAEEIIQTIGERLFQKIR